jgi:hypothetical protein
VGSVKGGHWFCCLQAKTKKNSTRQEKNSPFFIRAKLGGFGILLVKIRRSVCEILINFGFTQWRSCIEIKE